MTINFPEFIPGNSDSFGQDTTRKGGASKQAPKPRGFYARHAKRALDIALTVAAAPIVVPIIGALAITVRRDGGAAFYTQQRVGKDGRSFRMWKLRSMVCDADARMQGYLEANPTAAQEWHDTQKLKCDPRITAFGQFLRRSSLDELPQLWNVFNGDMSLVGPRPMMLDQRTLYPGTAYCELRPGITGFWQTEGRNETTFSARAHYDTVYAESLCLLTDLKILARTVRVVLKGTGY